MARLCIIFTMVKKYFLLCFCCVFAVFCCVLLGFDMLVFMCTAPFAMDLILFLCACACVTCYLLFAACFAYLLGLPCCVSIVMCPLLCVPCCVSLFMRPLLCVPCYVSFAMCPLLCVICCSLLYCLLGAPASTHLAKSPNKHV